jgi:hypothetical protein
MAGHGAQKLYRPRNCFDSELGLSTSTIALAQAIDLIGYIIVA